MNDDAKHVSGMISVDQPEHVVRTYASDVAALSGHGVTDDGKTSAPATPIREDVVADAPVASAPVEDAGTERMSILDRLRARAQGRAETPMPDAASRMNLGAGMIGQIAEAPTVNTPPPEFRPAPQPAATPAYSPPPPPAPHAPHAPSLSAIPAPSAPSPIHTYVSDFEDRIDAKQASSFSVLAAQQDAPRAAAAPKKRDTRGILFAIAGIVLVLGGGALAFFAYSATHKPVITVAPGVPSLIFFDDKVELSGTGGALMNALAQSAAQPLPDGEVRVAYLALSTTTKSGAMTVPSSGGALIGALALPAPDILLRNIDPSSTVGIVHAGTQTAAFFIVRVTSYDATFRGMLSWEAFMAHDLSPLYPAYPAPVAAPIATTTATSTAVIVPKASASAAAQFVDAVVASHDVRELKDSFGNAILLYGYADQSTLIIARDEAAFTALLGRIQSTR